MPSIATGNSQERAREIMRRPVVALLSDFGSCDHYVGVMKGVILGICPEATLVDISHDIPAHDIQAAALELASSYRFFPRECVFLAVVDPGVGTVRRGLAAESGIHRFVAPDNGVLTAVFKETPPTKLVELTERRYRRATVSRTFEGRDRFGPVAGWLANGVQLSELGPPVSEYKAIELPVMRVGDDGITGVVLRMDRFGNLVTNIDRGTLETLRCDGTIEITVSGVHVGRLVETYAEIASNEVCALFGSTDCLEIAARASSAGARLGLGQGAEVRVVRRLG